MPILGQRPNSDHTGVRPPPAGPGARASARGILAANPGQPPRSLYIHIPFCFHKCHYCDFYSLVDTQDRQDAFTDRLITELRALGPAASEPLRTIFIGGGTPTLLRDDLWARLLAALDQTFDLSDIRAGRGEWTVECNPETARPDLFALLRAGGVDRISLGAQSFNPAHLKTLERWHDPQNVARAVELARGAGIQRQSIDLIFAIPGQTLADLDADLRAALALGTTHVSCYSLTYEPRTAMTARLARGEFNPADEDLEVSMHELTLSTLRGAGLDRYEVSNYAAPGHESRHNLAYWRQEPWLAAGPSASAHIGGHRWKNIARLDDYLTGSDAGLPPITDHEGPDPRRALAERIMTGLRLREGLPWPALTRGAERLDPGAPARLEAQRRREIADGRVQNRDDLLALTDSGVLFADGIALGFMSALDTPPRR